MTPRVTMGSPWISIPRERFWKATLWIPEVHRVRKTEAHVLIHVRVGIEGAIEREIPHLEAGDSRDLEHDERTTRLTTERRQAYALTFQYDRLGDDDGRTPGRKRAGG